jgi:hypothetical protein
MKDEDILSAARKRMSAAIEADRDNREEALDDLENLAGRQWPEDVRQEREAENRPVVTINRLPQFVRQVTGDIRRLNPAIRVLPGDDEATEETADVLKGMIRQIEYASDAASIYEGAAESAAQCGMGYFRILTDYAHARAFEQEIRIKPIPNPFAVYFDPKARHPTRGDADYVFVTEQLDADDFKETYPDASMVDADHDGTTDGILDWMVSGRIVVAEYMWKEPQEITIARLVDGSIVENPPAELKPIIVQQRKTTVHKVMWAKITAKEVLEGPTELPCEYLPVIAVMGEEINVGDSIVRTGVIRWGKDSQRLYNFAVSAETEFMAIQPKAPYLVTATQVAGLEDMWAQANDANRPYLVYNPDEDAPPPQRQMPPQPSAALIEMRRSAADDMKATTGIYDAGLGARSNEQSGVAIRQRQLESDISTSIYTDNLSKAIEQCGRVLVDMIPKVYDTARSVRLVKDDDSEEVAQINGAQTVMTPDGPMVQPVNQLGYGRYDVRVSVGPNYSTRRQEVAANMMELASAIPQIAQVGPDILVKAADIPDGDKLAERLKRTVPPQVLGPDEQEQPDPQAQQAQMLAAQMAEQAAQMQMRKAQAEVVEAEADAQKAQADAVKAQAEAQEAVTRVQAGQMAMQQGFLPA